MRCALRYTHGGDGHEPRVGVAVSLIVNPGVLHLVCVVDNRILLGVEAPHQLLKATSVSVGRPCRGQA